MKSQCAKKKQSNGKIQFCIGVFNCVLIGKEFMAYVCIYVTDARLNNREIEKHLELQMC